MSDPWSAELETAVKAVRLASSVCQAVQHRLVSPQTLEKKDKSPVTVADFASQAVVCSCIDKAFPGDQIVGEEDSTELQQAQQASLCKAVVDHVATGLGEDAGRDQVLGWIDRGLGVGDGGSRFWTLDPIDGTKGFLRGGQYAVALGLIEQGQVVLGVLGCPNLPVGDNGDTGALVVAVRGQGAKLLPLNDSTSPLVGQSIKVSQLTTSAQARFCESVESGHSSQGEAASVAKLLGITAQPVRMDSQAKYATVARGQASIYLRLPTRADYREKIWDHAAGMIAVEEAGGRVTDVTGKPLDFTHGRALETNRGIIATNGTIHDQVVHAVGQVLG